MMNRRRLEIPIKEDYRGNVVVHVTLTVNNENHILTKVISVPWRTNILIFHSKLSEIKFFRELKKNGS